MSIHKQEELIDNIQQIRKTNSMIFKQLNYKSSDSEDDKQQKIDSANTVMRWLYDDDTINSKYMAEPSYYSSNIQIRLKPFFEELLIGHDVQSATKIANQNGFYFEHLHKDPQTTIYEHRIRYLEKDGIVTNIFLEMSDSFLWEKYAFDPQFENQRQFSLTES